MAPDDGMDVAELIRVRRENEKGTAGAVRKLILL